MKLFIKKLNNLRLGNRTCWSGILLSASNQNAGFSTKIARQFYDVAAVIKSNALLQLLHFAKNEEDVPIAKFEAKNVRLVT